MIRTYVLSNVKMKIKAFYNISGEREENAYYMLCYLYYKTEDRLDITCTKMRYADDRLKFII